MRLFSPKSQKLEAKPGRVARITEPMDAVELAELELDDVTGGCAACTGSQPAAKPVPMANLLPFVQRR